MKKTTTVRLPKDLSNILKTMKEGTYISEDIDVVWEFDTNETFLKLVDSEGLLLKEYKVELDAPLFDIINLIDFRDMAKREVIDFDKELLSIFYGKREQSYLF